MKVLLELLGDTCQLLSHMETLDELRPDSRDRLKALLHQLSFEASRLLEREAPGERAAGEGPGEEEGLVTAVSRDQFLQRALEGLGRQRYEEASRALLEGVEHFPEDEEFYGYLGLLAWELQDIESAERHYARAVELCFGTPDPPRIDESDERHLQGLRSLEGRGLCLYRLGRLDEALGIFEALGNVTLAEYVGCRYLAGEIYHTRGELEQAVWLYEQVPVEPAVLYNLGLARFQLDDIELAATTLIQAFVSNVHIACLLLGRYGYRSSCVPGYLGSETYAEEFTEACAGLWQTAPGAFRFLQRCFDHNLVQAHIQKCASRMGDHFMGSLEGVAEQESWLKQMHDTSTLTSMARRILQRLDA